MAPIDPTTSARLKLGYEGPYGRHTLLLRGGIDGIETDLTDAALLLIDEFQNWQYDGTVWDTAEFATGGVHFYTPVDSWTPITIDNAIGTSAADVPSRFMNMCGRSTATGRRTKLYLFEVAENGGHSMRLTAAENANVATLVDGLNGVGINLAAVDGTPVVWKNYVNFGQNDYLTHRARRS